MADIESQSQLWLKLRQAREAAGMSTRRVSESLPDRLKVSHVTLTHYEAGRSQPTLDLLVALADLYQRPINWFLEKSPALTGVRYRNRKSKVGVRELARYEAVAQKWLEAYQRLEKWLNAERRKKLPSVAGLPGAIAAERIREHLHLQERDPVQSVVEVMEMAGIRTMELGTDLAIDAMAGRLGDEDVVVLNPNVPNDRSRFNAAHELGHVIFSDCEDPTRTDRQELEKRAFEFASHFLLTRHMLRAAFHGRSMVRLVQFKERYGISLAAMVYRAEGEGIIPRDLAKRLWIEFSRRGWRTSEPGHVAEDRATRFEQLVDAAILSNDLTWAKAVVLTGVREDELRSRVNLALGANEPPSLPEKGGDEPTLRLMT